VMVDLARLLVPRVGPVRQLACTDATEDLVELVFADEEGVVLNDELAIRPDEVEGDSVVERDGVKGPEPDRRRSPEDFGQEGRGRLRIAGVNDRVIQFNGHVALQAAFNADSRDYRNPKPARRTWNSICTQRAHACTSSSGMQAVRTALNRAYGVRQGLSFWRARIKVTLFTLAFSTVVFAAFASVVVMPYLLVIAQKVSNGEVATARKAYERLSPARSSEQPPGSLSPSCSCTRCVEQAIS